jgi:hypothetical protein
MTFSASPRDRREPLLASAAASGFLQDVVVAATRVIHNQDLRPRDSRALVLSNQLVRALLNDDVVLRRSPNRELVDASALAALDAVRPRNSEERSRQLKALAEGIENVVNGRRDAPTTEIAVELRDLFLRAGKRGLERTTVEAQDGDTGDSWIASRPNSPS